MTDAIPPGSPALGVFGFPLTQQKATDIDGEDFDTYASPEQFIDYYSPQYPFHNARQRHVGIKAFVAGLRTTMWENLPKCPRLLQDVGHYWDGCTAIGYEVKSKGFAAAVTVVAIVIYQNPGIIGQSVQIGLKVFGA